MFGKKWVVLFAILILLAAAVFPNPGSARAAAGATQAAPDRSLPTNQIIIRYRPNTGAQASPAEARQMQRLSAAAGIGLVYARPMSGNGNVLRLPDRMSPVAVQAIARKLMTLPEVEYAEPDRIAVPLLTPNDTYYVGNPYDQWDLWDTYGINAPAAWDLTTGSASVVIADIDTGITDHSEFSGRIAPGYDFISDTWMANDGNGRDTDPHDPGDGITPNETQPGCPPEDSSWHGTHTAGTLGATGNNNKGIAGVNWVSKILPVRVLGRCGGYSSDISDAMRWAAGLAVPLAPANLNPAKVLNLSLGGEGACEASSDYQLAINDVVAAGAVVVVSAGNSNADAEGFSPASCSGVITVAATTAGGNKASYSNFGDTVEISAPGSGIYSTWNSGTQAPGTETYGSMNGTSMSAPHVTGVVSLMFSLNPDLTPTQVLTALESTARAFPEGSTCNTSNCGSGIVNAGAAVNYVMNPPAAFNKISPPNGSNRYSITTLSWHNSLRATSYFYCIQNTLGSGNTCTTPWVSTGANTSVNLTGLSLGPHYWQVRAHNLFGDTYANGGAWSSFNVIAAPVGPYLPLIYKIVPPGGFNKISPANGASSQMPELTLDWSDSARATSYEFCLSTSTCTPASTWTSTGANTSASITSLAENTYYYWQVRANGGGGVTYANTGTTWYFRTVAGSLLVNGDFEQGLTGWTEHSAGEYPIILPRAELAVSPHGGEYAAWLGGANNETSYIQQDVYVSASAPYLIYWQWIRSEEPTTECSSDFAEIMINDSLVQSYSLCELTATSGWVKHSLSLNAYAGETVKLQIWTITDGSQFSDLFVDDVYFSASSSGASAPTEASPEEPPAPSRSKPDVLTAPSSP